MFFLIYIKLEVVVVKVLKGLNLSGSSLVCADIHSRFNLNHSIFTIRSSSLNHLQFIILHFGIFAFVLSVDLHHEQFSSASGISTQLHH